MAEQPEGFEKLMESLAGGVADILREQKAQGGRLAELEKRINEGVGASPPERGKGGVTYDYRILQHVRCYTLADTQGERAQMESTRKCVALRDLPEVRTRYHTGAGDRGVVYEFRRVQEGEKGEPTWNSLEYKTLKGAGADYSAILTLPDPVLAGEVFEIRHSLELKDAFCSRNEWVTLMVEYPTESFRLEIVIPPGRKILGSRREESMGPSNSFNKRRVIPRSIPETGRISLLWDQEEPITGRAYTLYWDW